MTFDLRLSPEQLSRLRGAILERVYDNHRNQRTRYDHIVLWGVLRRVALLDPSRNEVLTQLQDLKERGYLMFDEVKDADDHRVFIHSIQITPRGRDIVEGRIVDAAVHVLGVR